MTHPGPAIPHPGGPVVQTANSWWRRLGLSGQVTIITAILGLVGALVPLAIAMARPDPTADPGPSGTTHTTPAKTTTSASPAESRRIRFTISDQLTDGVTEETIVVTMQGVRVATLHATVNEPIVTQLVEAATPGNVSYVCDAKLVWFDEAGQLRTLVASGRGNVSIYDGLRLDVYIHIESDGDVSLSLQSATGS